MRRLKKKKHDTSAIRNARVSLRSKICEFKHSLKAKIANIFSPGTALYGASEISWPRLVRTIIFTEINQFFRSSQHLRPENHTVTGLNKLSRIIAETLRATVGATRKCRPVVVRLGGAAFAAFQLTAGLMLPFVSIVLRKAGGALLQLVRWTHNHQRQATYMMLLMVASVIAFMLLARTPHREFGDFDESLKCMARNIYHEARGEPMVAQIAVAKVVMNRVSDHRFPNTVCAVIKQGGEWPHHTCQFSWWCDGRTDAIFDQRAMANIDSLAREVLRGNHDDPTSGAMSRPCLRIGANTLRKGRQSVGTSFIAHVDLYYLPRPQTIRALECPNNEPDR